MKKRVISYVLIVLLLASISPVYSHSGRTDSSGGHRDNKNASGLGSYHYHHGYPAHLHPNGVCPYASKPAPSPNPAPAPKINIYIDGQLVSFSQQPIIQNGTTLVPMRSIFEALGATVNWDEKTKTINAGKPGGNSIILTIDSKVAVVNSYQANVPDKTIELNIPAKIINQTTYVPLRFVGEALGDTVVWDGETNSIKIYKK